MKQNLLYAYTMCNLFHREFENYVIVHKYELKTENKYLHAGKM